MIRAAVLAAIGVLVLATASRAQLNQNCVVSVLNRTIEVNADGTWILPNIPANFGPVRARATCVNNGLTTFGQSALFTIPANGSSNVPPIVLGTTTPIPTAITLSSTATLLQTVGATAQLTVTATFARGTAADITPAASGTVYNVSNPAIATVSTGGLITAVSSGTVVIQAVNEGRQGIIDIQVVLAGASHGGIPDSWAIDHGLDPNDPAMPFEDPDHDGLTNLQEFQNGTDPHNPDTDGDGLTDGQEVLIYHTNPLLASTDGSGIPDGIEVQTGTLGGTLSAKLAKAVASLTVRPASFVLSVNTIVGIASQQLVVHGLLIDGKTTIDLTSTTEGTTYSSSDLTICNFGVPDGNIFAGNNGACTITVTNGIFSAQAMGIVNTFTPTDLSFIAIPGFANGVAVNGNFAYVAAGASGLQVVNVSDRTHPVIIATLPLAGNSNNARLLGTQLFVAGGSAGLQVVDISNPLRPVLAGTLGTSGTVLDVAVAGTTAYIANQTNLVIADVTTPAFMTRIATLPLTGLIQGVAVDPLRNLALVAAGTSGIYVVDISNPAKPAILGSVSTGDARNVAIKGNDAFVADFLNSTTSVDLTTPAMPKVLSHITDPNLGGFLQDITLSGNFALAADVKFFNGIPITDISDPTNLIARSILNFTQRDDNGMGIAADGTFTYLATEHSNLTKFGTTGDSRLYIGQYLALVDNNGIPPTAAITSPLSGSSVVQGQILPIVVKASDDVAVAAVNFLVNGQVVFTATATPYQYNFTVPQTLGPLTIGADAVDLGGNIGTAQSVTVNVIPDPGTTVIGRVIGATGSPLSGVTVTVLGRFTTTTQADGTFSISGVPTVLGSVFVSATTTVNGTVLNGGSAPIPPVLGGTTNVGTVVLAAAGNAIAASVASEVASDLNIDQLSIQSTITLGSASYGIAVTPDRTTAVATSFGSRVVTIINLTANPPVVTGTVAIPIDGEDIEITCLPSCFALVTDGGGSNTVVAVDIAGQRLASTLALPGTAEAVAAAPGGRVLTADDLGNTIHLASISPTGILSDTGASVSNGGSGPINVTVSPNGAVILVANWNDGSIGVLQNIVGGPVSFVNTLPSFPQALAIAFSPNGTHAYVLTSSGQVGVLNIDASNNVTDSGVRISVPSLPAYYGVDEIAVTSSSSKVLVHSPNLVTIIDASTNTVIGSITIPNDVSGGGLAVIP